MGHQTNRRKRFELTRTEKQKDRVSVPANGSVLILSSWSRYDKYYGKDDKRVNSANQSSHSRYHSALDGHRGFRVVEMQSLTVTARMEDSYL